MCIVINLSTVKTSEIKYYSIFKGIEYTIKSFLGIIIIIISIRGHVFKVIPMEQLIGLMSLPTVLCTTGWIYSPTHLKTLTVSLSQPYLTRQIFHGCSPMYVNVCVLVCVCFCASILTFNLWSCLICLEWWLTYIGVMPKVCACCVNA